MVGGSGAGGAGSGSVGGAVLGVEAVGFGVFDGDAFFVEVGFGVLGVVFVGVGVGVLAGVCTGATMGGFGVAFGVLNVGVGSAVTACVRVGLGSAEPLGGGADADVAMAVLCAVGVGPFPPASNTTRKATISRPTPAIAAGRSHFARDFASREIGNPSSSNGAARSANCAAAPLRQPTRIRCARASGGLTNIGAAIAGPIATSAARRRVSHSSHDFT